MHVENWTESMHFHYSSCHKFVILETNLLRYVVMGIMMIMFELLNINGS